MMRSTTQRGYGSRHQEIRKRLLPLAIGRPCSRCGNPMLDPKDIDLDHSDDRKGYRDGLFSHSSCNRSAAGFKSNGTAPQNPRPRPATRW